MCASSVEDPTVPVLMALDGGEAANVNRWAEGCWEGRAK